MGCTWNKICVSDPLPDIELVAMDQLGPALMQNKMRCKCCLQLIKAMVDTPMLITVLQKHCATIVLPSNESLLELSSCQSGATLSSP